MAAPSSTIWGSTASNDEGHEAKLGLAVSLSNTTSTSTVTIDIWFWSEYSVIDVYNTLYFDNEAITATTDRGNVEINTEVNSAWDESNQVHLGTYTYSYERGSSDVTKNCAAKLDTVEAIDKNPISVTTSYTIPALDLQTYTITYNANGGSGAPSSQTYTYASGGTVTLSTTIPTRTGYVFEGWSTSSSATTATYSAGGSFSTGIQNDTTLYAVWSVRPSQKVYIYLENGVVYARAFITADTTYIDSTGAIYSPSFVTGDSFGLYSTGIVATNFIEGTP